MAGVMEDTGDGATHTTDTDGVIQVIGEPDGAIQDTGVAVTTATITTTTLMEEEVQQHIMEAEIMPTTETTLLTEGTQPTETTLQTEEAIQQIEITLQTDLTATLILEEVLTM